MKSGPALGAVGGGDVAAVGLDDPLADGEAEAESRLLRAEEGLEKPNVDLGREAVSGVGDLDREPSPVRSGPGGGVVGGIVGDADGDGATLGDGVEGVEQEVEEHLAEVGGVGLDDERAVGELGLDDHRLQGGAGGDEAEDLVEDLDEVEGASLDLGGPGEVEEGLDRAFEPDDLLLEDRQGSAGEPGGPRRVLRRTGPGSSWR